PSAAPASVATPAVPTLAAGADVTPFLQQTATALASAASALRGASKADPAAYRVLRTSLYLAVAATPPVTQAPKTGLRPPPPQLRTQLQTLTANAKWAAVLDEAESALGMNRFWLDLHRYVFLALQGLGHAAAAEVVVAETAHLVRRFPTLATLQFSDGSTLASTDTVEWLGTIAGAPGGGAPAAEGADPVADAISTAKTLANGGKRDEALKGLQEAVRAAPDDRARFRLRLGLARLCAQGSPAAARGLLEGLARDIDTLHLDGWDPALAADALRAYLELLRDGAKTNPRVAEEAAEVYRRLCRIDVTLAIAAGG
ncbi:MAG: type VI secretion system domain-containing protein, partial [Deltaproteobacteria bacterium]|nr:type VI secretion system domain-containing protein [Deltaproteobacteria bacterium]